MGLTHKDAPTKIKCRNGEEALDYYIDVRYGSDTKNKIKNTVANLLASAYDISEELYDEIYDAVEDVYDDALDSADDFQDTVYNVYSELYDDIEFTTGNARGAIHIVSDGRNPFSKRVDFDYDEFMQDRWLPNIRPITTSASWKLKSGASRSKTYTYEPGKLKFHRGVTDYRDIIYSLGEDGYMMDEIIQEKLAAEDWDL